MNRLLSWAIIILLFAVVYTMASPELSEDGSVTLFAGIIDVNMCAIPQWGCWR